MRYANAGSRRRGQADTATDALARGLGWFSIALGLMEVVAPRRLSNALGMPDKSGIVQGYGVREIANGIAILTAKDATPWIWARVGGDALDISTLLSGYDDRNRRKENVGIALAAVAGVTAIDLCCASRLSTEAKRPPKPLRDYSRRSGFPLSPAQMRGRARDGGMSRDYPGLPDLCDVDGAEDMDGNGATPEMRSGSPQAAQQW
jgi:hypothetical protein